MLHNAAQRPYRSHKIPACEACRRRKSRCLVESADEACLFCRLRRTPCRRNGVVVANVSRVPATAAQQRYLRENLQSSQPSRSLKSPGRASSDFSEQHARPNATVGLPPTSPTFTESPDSESLHIVGPLATSDKAVLESSMLRNHDGHTEGASQELHNSSAVMYRRVHRVRPGRTPVAAGVRQLDIMCSIVGKENVSAIVALYRNIIHPCFPLLEEDHLISPNMAMTNPALLCTIVAETAYFWSESSRPNGLPRSEVNNLQNIAIDALLENFQALSVTTLLAALIDLMGRPSLDVIGNEGTLGRVVAAAYSMGLNRSPSADGEDSSFRRRLWWGIVIHDSWASLSHGIPPLLDRRYWNVELPTKQDIQCSSHSNGFTKATACFIALCSLTDILTQILPHIYTLRTMSTAQDFRQWEELDLKLHCWYEDLPTWISRDWATPRVAVAGKSNLYLSFLACRLTLARLNLRSRSLSDLDNLRTCHDAAVDIANLVEALDERTIVGFWLPYCAEHFTMTATVLLRYAVETRGTSDSRACLEKTRSMLEKLKHFRDQHDWDLGTDCLAQAGGIFERISSVLEETPATSNDFEKQSGATLDGLDFNAFEPGDLDTIFNIDNFQELGSWDNFIS